MLSLNEFPAAHQPTIARRWPRWRCVTGLFALLVPLIASAACSAPGSQWPSAAHAANDTPANVTTPRSNSATSAISATSQLTVVGLGDSVTSASNCDCPGFVHDYAELLSKLRGAPVRSINVGQPGLTSVQLDQRLNHDTPEQHAVGNADIVLITVGANDLMPSLRAWDTAGCDDTCAASGVDAVGSQISSIVGTVRTLRHGLPTQVLVTDYWNVFVDGDVATASRGQAYLAWSDRLTQRLNASICHAATSGGATCVDLYEPFKGDGTVNPTQLLAADGDHPNGAGHAVIARALLAETRG